MGWTAKPSVQRMLVNANPRVVASDYFDWVNRVIPFVSVRRDGENVAFHMFGIDRPAIALTPHSDGEERLAYRVDGGFMTRPNDVPSIFEFLKTGPREITISLSHFAPRLPPIVYVLTHGIVHAIVMSLYVRRDDVPRLESDG